MYDAEADKKAREFFQKLRGKCKTPEEIGGAIDKAIDFYFEQKAEAQQVQLELF